MLVQQSAAAKTKFPMNKENMYGEGGQGGKEHVRSMPRMPKMMKHRYGE